MLHFSPGSFYHIQTNDFYVEQGLVPRKKVFLRIFWTFRQCCEAFEFAKPVIQIDGTHLYGKYKGKLLVATSQDGNDECLPNAFAIVEGETLEAWDYFLVNIRAHVTEMSNICLISDRHRSIISAVENNRYTPADFERGLARFRETSPQIVEWIDVIPKEKWSRAYDVEGRRYEHMTTNLAESVNSELKGARNMPITALVKHTYSRLKNEVLATSHHVRAYNVEHTVFEVDAGWDRSYSVNLPQRFSQCGNFKAFKYPCSHAAAAALSPIGNEEAIPPSTGPQLIPDSTMLRAKGRPKSTRIRNEMDEVETSQSCIRCGICKERDHNRRAYPNRGANN
ncbi:uncharacterized protein LOC133295278 [Gastrolobium bilobum]|uniref:uncharacterized protein LOC133295278 n=1 Tax=Gastrolobium bilobum TaxID=150636 RepID=UPI002AAF2C7C|nr:uncharacterized protein LOC133295278 [Gastrolobium bilobum]